MPRMDAAVAAGALSTSLLAVTVLHMPIASCRTLDALHELVNLAAAQGRSKCWRVDAPMSSPQPVMTKSWQINSSFLASQGDCSEARSPLSSRVPIKIEPQLPSVVTFLLIHCLGVLLCFTSSLPFQNFLRFPVEQTTFPSHAHLRVYFLDNGVFHFIVKL